MGKDGVFEVFAELIDELVGKVEDEDGGALDRVLEGRIGMEIRRQGDIREIFDVLMEVIDEVCELLWFGGIDGRSIVFLRGLWY